MSILSTKICRPKGFMLIEVIAATAIIAVSLTLIMQSFISSTRAVALQKDYTQAIFMLENHLSRMLYTGADIPEKNSEEQKSKFEYKHTLAKTDEEFLKTVVLTVKWPSGKKERDLSVTTWLFKAAHEKTRIFF
jgi:type II secretion system protein I